MNIKEKTKNVMKESQSGFAITIEVMVSLLTVTLIMLNTTYLLTAMNTQRYMNTVLTSTAAEASRWGGVDTKAYRANVSDTSIISRAQSNMSDIPVGYCPRISGTPKTISDNSEIITITIDYNLPGIFEMSGNKTSYESGCPGAKMQMKVNINSVMEAGKLL